MYIEFYNIETGETVPTGDYFVYNGNEVWCDNCKYYESQSASIGFDNCVVQCGGIGWRTVEI